MSAPPVDVLTFTVRDREVWDQAYLSGYCAGHEAGWKAADDAAAAAFNLAVRVVRLAATLPPRDRAADASRGARRDRRWAS